MKVEPENQQLMNERGTEIFDDDKQLSDYNLSAQTARAQSPATVALAFRWSSVYCCSLCHAFIFYLIVLFLVLKTPSLHNYYSQMVGTLEQPLN